jgi:hypothetical protein
MVIDLILEQAGVGRQSQSTVDPISPQSNPSPNIEGDG